MPLKNPTRWVSEGCPLSTEWEAIERGVALEREGGFERCPRAVSLRLKPPICITYNFDLIIYNNYYKFYNCYHKLHNCIE